ncbi:hypothetical protein V1478_006531, partial [Vespula squamosa]
MDDILLCHLCHTYVVLIRNSWISFLLLLLFILVLLLLLLLLFPHLYLHLLLLLPSLRFFATRRIRMKQFVCKCGPLLGKSCQYIVNGDRVCCEYEEEEEEEEEEPLIDLNDSQEKKKRTKGSTNCPMDFILKSSLNRVGGCTVLLIARAHVERMSRGLEPMPGAS